MSNFIKTLKSLNYGQIIPPAIAILSFVVLISMIVILLRDKLKNKPVEKTSTDDKPKPITVREFLETYAREHDITNMDVTVVLASDPGDCIAAFQYKDKTYKFESGWNTPTALDIALESELATDPDDVYFLDEQFAMVPSPIIYVKNVEIPTQPEQKSNELHLYESDITCPPHTIHGIREADLAIQTKDAVIHTTQMCLLNDGGRLLEKDWKIFIHEPDGSVYELRLGNCDRTDKEIRPAHNLYRLWRAGAFQKRS